MADPLLSSVRRRPEQARSRKRVDDILHATKHLIADRGISPWTMTDIASEAGMGLTALYRYFPNKMSVVRQLALEMLESDRNTLLQEVLNLDGSLEDILRISSHAYIKLHDDEPFRLALQTVIRSDATLCAADIADTRENASALADKIVDRAPASDRVALERFFILHLTTLNAVIQLIAHLDDPVDSDAIVDAMMVMATEQLTRCVTPTA